MGGGFAGTSTPVKDGGRRHMAGALDVNKWVRRPRVAEPLPWGSADG